MLTSSTSLVSAMHRCIQDNGSLWPDSSLLNATRIQSMTDEHSQRLGNAGHARTAFCCLTDDSAAIALFDRERNAVNLYALAATSVASVRNLFHTLESEVAAQGIQPVRWVLGGPAGGYLLSGWPAADMMMHEALGSLGFVELSRHVDLHVELREAQALDKRIHRVSATELESVGEAITQGFAPAWKQEAQEAYERGNGLFVGSIDGQWTGFSAHSGHNVAVGTFGPLGVLPAFRNAGMGQALACAALDDLAKKGFSWAVIPWVDPARLAFYARCVRSVRAEERVRWIRRTKG